jgi:transposase
MTTFTVKQLCDRYCVGESTVLGWIARGDLAALNCGRAPGKKKPRWRVTPEALAAFELSRTASAPPQRPRRKQLAGVTEFIR